MIVEKSNGVCPVNHSASNGVAKPQVDDVLLVDIDVDSISTVPSVKEYKKLRNVMSMITRFYRDGSEKKGAVSIAQQFVTE
jgi:hypothetical protein